MAVGAREAKRVAEQRDDFRPTRQRVAVLRELGQLGVFSSALAAHEALEHRGEHVVQRHVHLRRNRHARRGLDRCLNW